VKTCMNIVYIYLHICIPSLCLQVPEACRAIPLVYCWPAAVEPTEHCRNRSSGGFFQHIRCGHMQLVGSVTCTPTAV
jgi:hypothetical protein